MIGNNSSTAVAQMVRKPKRLGSGARLSIVAPASPATEDRTRAGIKELKRLGFLVCDWKPGTPEGYFAASSRQRAAQLFNDLADPRIDGLVALRGGYGSNYLLGEDGADTLEAPKSVIGFSDLTTLQIFLWEKLKWISFYGPMVAAGLDSGAGAAGGYDEASFRMALTGTANEWQVPLAGETIAQGEAEGRVLGGAMTLVEATIGTPWELDTRGSILLLEDRGMRPYQVDRVLMHLKQAGKFNGVRGIILGEFPECPPPVPGSPAVIDVCRRILEPLGIPIAFGAAVGHTARPMLTIPLGVTARLGATEQGVLQILEAAVTS